MAQNIASISNRFLDESTILISSRFLREATGAGLKMERQQTQEADPAYGSASASGAAIEGWFWPFDRERGTSVVRI